MKNRTFLLVILFLPFFEVSNAQNASFPQFVVISDTHFDNGIGGGAMQKVPNALKHLFAEAPNADALFVVGDVTDHGDPEQWDKALSVFNNTENVPSGTPYYLLMGNHDNYRSGNGADTTLYKSKTGQPLHQYIEIKGYPFITISENGGAENDYNATAVNFLAAKMAQAATDYPGKPIFVFIHIPPSNTTYGSYAADGGNWGTDLFKATLNQYPQAVVFSGHTHFPVGDPRSIFQGNFTVVNTGSTTYCWMRDNTIDGAKPQPSYAYITEGYVVTVKENGDVELQRWDTYRDEAILNTWTIKAPHNGTQFTYKDRNGLPVPVFAENAKPVISDITKYACTVTFPQATDNDVVERYRIIVKNAEGATIRDFYKFSLHYLNSEMPNELSAVVSGLKSGTTYTVQVVAHDSYDNISDAIASEFTTQDNSSATFPAKKGHWLFDDASDLMKANVGVDLESADGNYTQLIGVGESNGAIRDGHGQYLICHHNIGANGGGQYTNEYTIMMDLKIDRANDWYGIYQTHSDFSTDQEADLWIDGSNGSVGVDHVYGGNIQANQWARLVMSVSLSSGKYDIFMNGNKCSSLNLRILGLDGRMSLDANTILLAADNTGYDNPVYISEIAIWDVALTDEEVAVLEQAGSPTQPTSIKQLNNDELNVFFLNRKLHFPKNISGKVTVFALDGKLLATGEIGNGKNTLEVADNRGIMLVRIKDKDGNVTNVKCK
jgi:predicted phosphodiesterase